MVNRGEERQCSRCCLHPRPRPNGKADAGTFDRREIIDALRYQVRAGCGAAEALRPLVMGKLLRGSSSERCSRHAPSKTHTLVDKSLKIIGFFNAIECVAGRRVKNTDSRTSVIAHSHDGMMS